MCMPITKCFSCGVELKRSASELREKNFCNHKCYSIYKKKLWTSETNPRWTGGEIEKNCVYCGKQFKSKRYGRKRDDLIKYCSISCSAKDRGKNQRQENHPNWKGCGINRTAKRIRSTARYKQWIKDVLKRDEYTCCECGNKEHLHVHHIKRIADIVENYIKENKTLNVDDNVFYDLANGKTLCCKCHRKTFKV